MIQSKNLQSQTVRKISNILNHLRQKNLITSWVVTLSVYSEIWLKTMN